MFKEIGRVVELLKYPQSIILGLDKVASSLDILGSVRECILKQAENIPLECMYMKWE